MVTQENIVGEGEAVGKKIGCVGREWGWGKTGVAKVGPIPQKRNLGLYLKKHGGWGKKALFTQSRSKSSAHIGGLGGKKKATSMQWV